MQVTAMLALDKVRWFVFKDSLLECWERTGGRQQKLLAVEVSYGDSKISRLHIYFGGKINSTCWLWGEEGRRMWGKGRKRVILSLGRWKRMDGRVICHLQKWGRPREGRKLWIVLEMLKFETNIRFPTADTKYTPRHGVQGWEEWSSY